MSFQRNGEVRSATGSRQYSLKQTPIVACGRRRPTWRCYRNGPSTSTSSRKASSKSSSGKASQRDDTSAITASMRATRATQDWTSEDVGPPTSTPWARPLAASCAARCSRSSAENALSVKATSSAPMRRLGRPLPRLWDRHRRSCGALALDREFGRRDHRCVAQSGPSHGG
jgi:hypothetical protein